MAKLFSVIIPTLNEEKLLPKLLLDLSKQVYKNFEVMVVDGNSEDKTIAKAEEYKERLDLRIIFSPKQNVSHQRNLGAKAAEGTYLVFIDADSRLGTTYLKRIAQHIRKDKYLIYLPVAKPQDSTYSDVAYAKFSIFLSEMAKAFGKPFIPSNSQVFKRDYFYHLGGYDEKAFIFEDHHIIQKAFTYGVSAKIMKDVVIKFSFRRFQKEGRMSVYSRYIFATFHMLMKGKVNEKLFEYEMGGNAKYLTGRQKGRSFDKTLKKSFKSFKEFFSDTT